MKILGISGSIRENSFSTQALRRGLEIAKDHGAEIIEVNLKTLKLPFCDGSAHYPDYPDVEYLRSAFQSTVGILIVTPEYHGCVSGVLKNALDLLDYPHIEGKIAALVSVLGGEPSRDAINSLRIILRQLHAWVLPEQLIIPFSEQAFQNQALASPFEERLEKLVHTLIQKAHRLHHQ